MTISAKERIAEAERAKVRAEERERCARVVETMKPVRVPLERGEGGGTISVLIAASPQHIAAAIRKGEPER